MLSEQTWMIAQDLIRVIFEDMDPVWLRSMWKTRGSARAYMIEILMQIGGPTAENHPNGDLAIRTLCYFYTLFMFCLSPIRMASCPVQTRSCICFI